MSQSSQILSLVAGLPVYEKKEYQIPMTLKKFRSRNLRVSEIKEILKSANLVSLPHEEIDKTSGKKLKEWAENNKDLFSPEPEKPPLLERKARKKDTNDVEGRVGSIIRMIAGSMQHLYKISDEEYDARHVYARHLRCKYSIDEYRDFFTNDRIHNKMSGSTNDHLYPLVENKKWSGYHPSDPLNLVLVKVDTNREKGNKSPEQFLKDSMIRGDINYQQYNDRMAYLGEIHEHIKKVEGEELEFRQKRNEEALNLLISKVLE
tara:strand:- start:3746 stop:4531 length:786 start_codon:yes stop_codon:yes gene_type:complete